MPPTLRLLPPETNLDLHPVARDEGVCEERPRLGEKLRRLPAVARRNMGQDQPADSRPGGEFGGLTGGRMTGLLGTGMVLVAEGGLVHQEIGAPGRLTEPRAGSGVAGDDNLPARTRHADQFRRCDLLAVGRG